MKAVGLYRYLPIDHAESFLDLEVETPVAQGHDLLVEVKAVSVNPVDYKMRAPKDQVETTPRILGWDAARRPRPATLPIALAAGFRRRQKLAKDLKFAIVVPLMRTMISPTLDACYVRWALGVLLVT